MFLKVFVNIFKTFMPSNFISIELSNFVSDEFTSLFKSWGSSFTPLSLVLESLVISTQKQYKVSEQKVSKLAKLFIHCC